MYSYSNRFAVSRVLVSYLLLPCIGFKGVNASNSMTELKSGIQKSMQEYVHASKFNSQNLNRISANFNLQKGTQTKNLTNTSSRNAKALFKEQKDKAISVNYNQKPLVASKNVITKDASAATKTNEIKHKNRQPVESNLPISEVAMIDEAIRGKLPTFVAHDGYEVIFMYQQGEWIAYVTQHLAVGRRILVLPVYGDLGVSIDNLLSSGPEWQERHIYVFSPTTDTPDKSAPYVYISMVEMQDNGLRVDVNKTLANLIIGYYLTGRSNQIEFYKLKNWEAMLLEISSLLAGIRVNLVVSSIDPDPDKIKTKLEQLIYKYLNRQVKLEKYALTYNQLLTEVINQIESRNNSSIYHPFNYPESYLVTLKIKLRNIYPLLLEIDKIKDTQIDQPASFDLTKILEIIEIKVTSKDLPDRGELLSKTADPFLLVEKQEEVRVSTMLPNLTANSSRQLFGDNKTNSYPALYEQLPNEHMNEVEVYLDEYDLPSSMHIPQLIQLSTGSTVKVTFGSSLKQPENLIISADRLVDQRLIPTLIQALNIASETVKIESIHISATTNGHEGKQYTNSNHRKENGARAIDISRINGNNIFDLGTNNPLVIALQNALDETPYIRENFGPYFRHKKRKTYQSNGLHQGHKNHIHFSINR